MSERFLIARYGVQDVNGHVGDCGFSVAGEDVFSLSTLSTFVDDVIVPHTEGSIVKVGLEFVERRDVGTLAGDTSAMYALCIVCAASDGHQVDVVFPAPLPGDLVAVGNVLQASPTLIALVETQLTLLLKKPFFEKRSFIYTRKVR